MLCDGGIEFRHADVEVSERSLADSDVVCLLFICLF
jgi:hypothetical protein